MYVPGDDSVNVGLRLRLVAATGFVYTVATATQLKPIKPMIVFNTVTTYNIGHVISLVSGVSGYSGYSILSFFVVQ